MRVLIVGGGIAGLTLAALLRRQGCSPQVVEKVPAYAEVGYVLTLWPLGSRVLHGLDLIDEFTRASVPVSRYVIHDAHARLLREMNFASWLDPYGGARTLARAELLGILASAVDPPVRMGVSVCSMEERDSVVRVRLSDGEETEYDLVVGADGIHSATRTQLFGRVPMRDTGWLLHWWWSHEEPADYDIREYWGPGILLGCYPARDRIALAGVIPKAPRGVTDGRAEQVLRRRLRALSRPGGHWAAEALDRADEVAPVDLSDIRSPSWSTERVLLIGDAATGFLPTAGVGASMAMESAAVLADELSRTDAAHVPSAVRRYVTRRYDRVNSVQQGSRGLAEFMFRRDPLVVRARDTLLRHMPEAWLRGEVVARHERPA